MKKLENKSKAQKEVENSDKFQQGADQIRDKVIANKDKYQKYLIYVVAIIALGYAYLNYQSEVEAEANSLFGIAMIDFENQQSEQARQKFEAIIYEFDGSEAAARANFMLGKIYFEQNLVQQALANFSNYNGSDPLFKAASIAGIAMCHEAEKNYASAAEYYLQASSEEERIQSSLDYKFSAALNYERANDLTRAKQLFEEILKSDEEYNQKKFVELKLGLL